ncbi:MAG: HlyC/CorC family transporter [Alphaproteobacteria bacterium]|nr:HlyC/CorC family transporter [Alphaproteobacteria bacterium]
MSQHHILTVVIIVVLLALSAFFSLSETALTAVSRPRMYQLERKGVKKAGLVNRLRETQERLIGAILLGNNLVNILSSALATSLFIAWFGDAGVAYSTLAMTLFIVLLGEIAPKVYALTHADRTALAVATPIRFVVRALSPITAGFHLTAIGLLRLLGAETRARRSATALEEELRGVIAMHTVSDAEARREGAMLRSILDLAELEVGEIMIHRKTVQMLDLARPTSELVAEALASPYTRLPLYREDAENIVGVLHAKALLRGIAAAGGKSDGIELDKLASLPWFVPDSTSVLSQLQAFRQRHKHFAVVVDEYGLFMGIVTLEDILEEIVGEMSDEQGLSVAGVRPQRDGSYIIDGTVSIRELNRQFDWELPDEEASTIAGLVLHEARVIPDSGQVFEFYGFRFEILRRQRNQLTLLRLTPPAGAKSAERAA